MEDKFKLITGRKFQICEDINMRRYRPEHTMGPEDKDETMWAQNISTQKKDL